MIGTPNVSSVIQKTSALMAVALSMLLGSASCTNTKGKDMQENASDITDQERGEWLAGVGEAGSGKGGVVSEVRELGGMPGLYFNGKPLGMQEMYFGYLYDDYGYKQAPDKDWHARHGADLAGSGIHSYQTDVVISLPGGRVDLSRANSQIAGMLRSDPEAKFVLRVSFKCGDEFAERHPDEVVVFNDGAKSHYTRPGSAALSKVSTPRYSLASRIWEREAAQGLVNMVKALSKTSYSDRIVAHIVGVGAYSQGLYWVDFDQEKYGIDYSPAMKRRFLAYVKSKYQGDIGKLRVAWNDDKAAFESIELPTMLERGQDTPSSCNEMPYSIPGGFGYFRDPGEGQNQKVIDYYMCMSMEVGERIIYLCKALKRASGGRALVGTMYSPLSILGYSWGGESFFRDVLNARDIDFWVYPWAYEGRGPGENIFFTSPMSSQAIRSKPSMIECDLRSSATHVRGLGAPLDVKGDVENIKKSFARIATYGAYGYWFEMGLGWYDKPEIFKAFADVSRVGREVLGLDRRRNAEIAVVYDQESLFYASEWLSFVTLCREAIQEFGYIGADYDIYEMDDLARPEMDKYKLYIFPNAFALDNQERAKIKSRLQRDGKTLLWLYAPGLVNPDKKPALSLENMRELTGMNFGYLDGRHGCGQTLVGGSSLLVNNPKASPAFGDFVRPVTTGHGCSPEKPLLVNRLTNYPEIFVDDSSAEVLGKFNDSGRTGSAMRKMGDWTSVYFGGVAVPSWMLREVARNAGVHIYLDTDDLVYTNQSLLGISARVAGEKVVKLPGRCDVYDLFRNRLVAKGVTEFTLSLPAEATELYFVGDCKDFPPNRGEAKTQNEARP